jgi:GT2 family glycosyltransferase
LKGKSGVVDLSWHPDARVVREDRLGLTYARLRGFEEARGDLLVMVDDDNVLVADYLATAVRIAGGRPALGAFGGKALPVFEFAPPAWVAGISSGLGLRDLGDQEIAYPPGQNARVGRRQIGEFPSCAPIGAGMVLRREAAAAYAERLRANGVDVTDRRGDSLSSAGDNDICLTVLEEGWQVGYFPELRLQHLIPEARTTIAYQRRMAREAMRSFILMLDRHGIRPWAAIPKWSVPLRVANDCLRVRPWSSPERLLRWSMNRGRYEACGSIKKTPKSCGSN